MKPPAFLHVLVALVVTCSAAPQVKIGNTTVNGRDIPTLQQEFFGGMPYAQPPLGQLRLKPPILKTTLDGDSFDASNFGPGCLQLPVANTSLSEDCLSINIFRPSNIHPNTRLPVLVWVYGGGFLMGTASNFNGSAIVAQSVIRGTPLIYVNFNYRLGPLGFPQSKEADDKKALNLGIRDEIAALEWVQKNIGLFGGDNTKVTVFGESAGAIMISILFLNKFFPKLARGAIIESGSQASALNDNASRRKVDWQNFVGGVASCASLATSGNTFDCLRNATSDEIQTGLIAVLNETSGQFIFEPTIDGPGGLCPDFPSRLLVQGKFAKLPFITGTNLDEGTTFAPTTINSEDEVRQSLITNFGPAIVPEDRLIYTIDTLLKLYPDIPALGCPFNTGNNTFGLPRQFKQGAALIGDISFHSQRRLWQATATRTGVRTWGYLFTQPQPDLPPFLGVTHSSEVPYVYGAPTDQSASALKISALMIDYWVSFATSLNPNDGKGLQRPTWDHYIIGNEHVMELNGNNTAMIPDTFRKKQMDFINDVPAVFLH